MYRLFLNQQRKIADSLKEGFDKVVNKLDELKVIVLMRDPERRGENK